MDLYFDWLLTNYNKQENIKTSLSTIKFVIIGEIIMSIIFFGVLWKESNNTFWSAFIMLLSFVFCLKSVLINHSKLKTTKLYHVYYFSELGLLLGLVALKRSTTFLTNNYFVLLVIYVFIGFYLYLEKVLKKENLKVTTDYHEFIDLLKTLGISYKMTFFNLEKVYEDLKTDNFFPIQLSNELLTVSKQINSYKKQIADTVKKHELSTQQDLINYFPKEFLEQLSETHHVLQVNTNSKEILDVVELKELDYFKLINKISEFKE